jgi:hypothetical protein
MSYSILLVSPRRWARSGLALGMLGLTGLSCSGLTSVDAPDVRQPADYTTAAGASALATGAMTRFIDAFGAAYQQVTLSGLIADELVATANNVALGWDNRNPSEPAVDGGGLYARLHGARINLLTAIAALQGTAPDSSARIGQLFAINAYTEVFFGEGFCAGVPLSRLDSDFRPLYGPPLTGAQLYQQAVADFDSALLYAANSARISQLAQVGKGRALLNLGRFSEAAEAVAGVPTSYVYHATFVMGTLENGHSDNTGFQNRVTVPEQEGGNGLDWRTANDPRVMLLNRSPAVMGFDRVTEVWVFVPYRASNAPIPLASGLEARLIEAEAALQVGDPVTWLNIHNALRATAITPALPALTDPGTAALRVDLHFRERAFWLFLTGHRHGDLRRLVRQYGRDAETVFPTGAWRDGLTYGTATNIAPPASQSNNPNYSGCLNRDA